RANRAQVHKDRSMARDRFPEVFVDIAEPKEFLKNNHRGYLVTRKKDASLQMTLVSPVLGADGNVIITARDTTYKVKNIGRNPQLLAGVRREIQRLELYPDRR